MNQRLAICQWCLPDQGPQGLSLAASMGYDGVEMDMGLNDSSRDLRHADVLARYVDAKVRAGIATPSLALNYICLNDASRQAETKVMLDQAVQVALALDARTLQLPSFWEGGMRTEAEFCATVEMLRYACEQALPHGLMVASENQLNAEGNRRLIEAVGTENFGVYFDTANPYLFDDRDGLALLDALYPMIVECHIKDYQLTGQKPCAPLGQGDCHAEEALNYLKQRGYDRWLVVENALDGSSLAKDAAYIRENLARKE